MQYMYIREHQGVHYYSLYIQYMYIREHQGVHYYFQYIYTVHVYQGASGSTLLLPIYIQYMYIREHQGVHYYSLYIYSTCISGSIREYTTTPYIYTVHVYQGASGSTLLLPIYIQYMYIREHQGVHYYSLYIYSTCISGSIREYTTTPYIYTVHVYQGASGSTLLLPIYIQYMYIREHQGVHYYSLYIYSTCISGSTLLLPVYIQYMYIRKHQGVCYYSLY